MVLETQSGLGCPTSTGDHCRSSVRRMGCVRNCQEHYNSVKKFFPVLITICQVDYLHGSWWPKMEDLREMGIPCYRFLIYTSTRWPSVKSFNPNLFLKLVLYLSHVSQIAGSCSVPESWSGSTLAAFTGFRLDQRHHDVHRHYEYSCSCCWF